MTSPQMRAAIARALVNNPAVIRRQTTKISTRTSFDILALFQNCGRTYHYIRNTQSRNSNTAPEYPPRDGHLH